jgi:hypothetical protein
MILSWRRGPHGDASHILNDWIQSFERYFIQGQVLEGTTSTLTPDLLLDGGG